LNRKKNSHFVERTVPLLNEHQLPLIEELKASAFDLLSPRQVASELNIEPVDLPDLVRQGWLAPAPNQKIGSANLYYRWRVEFAKRYRRRYQKNTQNTPLTDTIV
jgi:hypothetical protein